MGRIESGRFCVCRNERHSCWQSAMKFGYQIHIRFYVFAKGVARTIIIHIVARPCCIAIERGTKK